MSKHTMTPAKTLQLLKRYREIKTALASVDYRYSRWCADVRVEFTPGATGDKSFHDWTSTELGAARIDSDDMLRRARAISIVPDEAQWNKHGAFKKIEAVLGVEGRREQLAVLQDAEVSGKALATVIRERTARRLPTAPASGAPPMPGRVVPVVAHVRGDGSASAPSRPAVSGQRDDDAFKAWVIELSASVITNALAEQVADGILDAPKHIVVIARRRAAALRTTHAKRVA